MATLVKRRWDAARKWREKASPERAAPYWTVGLLAYFVGLITLPAVTDFSMDDGFATLLGSAVGAAVTVFGSLWVVQYQARSRSRAFSRLVAETAAGMRDEAYSLVSLLAEESWESNRAYASQILEQIDRVVESFELFKQLSPYSEIENYTARLLINRLQMKIEKNLSLVEKEKEWLGKPTENVLNNTRKKMTRPATELQEIASLVMTSLNLEKPLPTQESLKRDWTAMLPTSADDAPNGASNGSEAVLEQHAS